MATKWEYRGILPAMQLPFDQALAIDEPELRRFASWLAGHNGIGGLVTNGHTGEVFALTAKQRAEATFGSAAFQSAGLAPSPAAAIAWHSCVKSASIGARSAGAPRTARSSSIAC